MIPSSVMATPLTLNEMSNRSIRLTGAIGSISNM